MSILKAIGNFFNKLFNRGKVILAELLPIATGVVQTLKTIDDLTGDLLAKVLGGKAESIQKKLREAIAFALRELGLLNKVQSAPNDAELNAALRDFLTQIKFNSDETKQRLITNFAAMILQKLFTVKPITFGTASVMVEGHFKTAIQPSDGTEFDVVTATN